MPAGDATPSRGTTPSAETTAPAETPPPCQRLGRVLLAILVLHVLFCALRIPHSVIWKRMGEVRDYRHRGPTRYLLDGRHHGGAAAVEWILAHTGEDAVVLWQGEARGSFEIVAYLIHPRLLYPRSLVPPEQERVHGRPVAERVLHGAGRELELRRR